MSVDYLELVSSSASNTLQHYFDALRICESKSSVDHSSAVLIQRRWRGYRDRQYLAYLRLQANHIQRVYRGYRGRLHFLLTLRQRQYAIQRSYFDSMATKIQKVMRGFLSRKFVQDMYKRRAYINAVAERGDELNRLAEENLERQIIATDLATIESRSIQFEEMSKNIHHLVGTKTIPSVFKSRLGPEFDATAFDIPLETHIKEAFHNRQTELRKMRKQIFKSPTAATTSSSNQLQPQQQQQPQARTQQPQRLSHPSQLASTSISATAVVPVAQSAAVFSPSPPASVTPSIRGSSAGSRGVSRPTSGSRLAPLTSSSQSQSSQSQSVSTTPLPSTQKLPSIRSVAGTPSGRTLNASDLYHSKIGGFTSPDIEEEKQQLPLALALGGHVSTTPTRMSQMANTRHMNKHQVTSPSIRKWGQPIKPNIQRTEEE